MESFYFILIFNEEMRGIIQMKKVCSVLLVMIIVLSLSVSGAFAEGSSADVIVTIISETGAPAVAAEPITVADTDKDGALTINDALYTAHEMFYENGAAAGYATSVTQYGLGITKLWGSTSGSYGYYVNNASAWNLSDPIQTGDYIAAFVYTDSIGWSDHYSYFDRAADEITAGEAFTLTYSEAGYDDEWNPVVLPVKGAVITVDGIATEFKTDDEGKTTITLNENGYHIVSATVEGKLLITPVFVADVDGAVEQVTATQAPTQAPTKAATPDQVSNPNAIKTGGSAAAFYVLLCGMIFAAAVLILRKRYEA